MQLRNSIHRFNPLLVFMFLMLVMQNGRLGAQCIVPDDLSTSNITGSEATLSWDITPADSFLVRYYESGTSLYFYKSVSSGTTYNTIISGLYPNTTYYWQVRSWCNNGMASAYQANPTVFTTANVPAYCLIPNLTASYNITSNSALVSWNTMIDADSFMVRYAVSGTTNYNWITVHGSQHSVQINGLLSNTSYDWWVRCICTPNPSQPYSILNTFTTLSASCGIPNVAQFTSTGITSGSATVGWPTVSGALYYNVRYAVRYSGNWITVSSNTNNSTLIALTSNTLYEFQVQTVCASGLGAWSSSGIFTTLSGTLRLTRGPYLQLATPNSVYIRWRTNNPSDTRIRFGTDPSSLFYSVSNSTPTDEHILQITGLNPSTKYYYSIGSSSVTLQGDTGNYFVTNPVEGTNTPIRIWAIGDFGRASSAQHKVRDSYMNYTANTHTDVWLWLGDNAYNDGTDSEYQTKVFDMYPHQFNKWVTWPSPGNHDLHTANALNQSGPYFDNFTVPTAGEAGGVPSGTEAYYSYNYGNVHFVSLESYHSTHRNANGNMANWLRSDLAANTMPWTIVYFHHPPYTKGSHDSDTERELIEMRTNIVPILESYNVDLVLAGHSHCYERSMLIHGHYGNESSFNISTMAMDPGTGTLPTPYDKTSPSLTGTVYAVCGTGGTISGISSGWPHNAMKEYTVSHHGSMVIDINRDKLTAKYLTSTGTIRDEFTIEKQNLITKTNFVPPGILNSQSNTFELYPNPAHDILTLVYQLKNKAEVNFELLDVTGRKIADLGSEGIKNPGIFEMSFNVRDEGLTTGVYLVRMFTADESITRKVIVE